MESVGKFEFNRKDLIGHGAFAVVFKGRHKEKRDWVVAVKCINKKNLAKSQSLLGKEIKILKELKHENIVRLLDYQEKGGCVYLVMEYCNGGDLAEYLHSKGTLSEDTIRVFLQQIGRAMRVLQGKGILHRDLKPQNILLSHPEGRRSGPTKTCIKIADFGFARHLQSNTMAATLCGSPMYMAPEVIMSQNYDAKADLWSIGTVVYQCLTGKAPFHASTPQELRLFYETNRSLLPSIPKETSAHLRHLLLGLLQRNHRERIGFDEFFHHPFLETSSPTKKCSAAPALSFPSSGSISSSSSSSTSHPASPQHSRGETQRLQPNVQYSQTQDVPDEDTSSSSEDYVMVAAQFPSECTCEESCLIFTGSSLLAQRSPRPAERTPPPPPPPQLHPPSSPASPSLPIPVPSQVRNYQRLEQNLQPAHCGGFELNSPQLAAGGGRPQQSSPLAGMSPKTSEQTLPLSTRTEPLQDPSGPKLQSRVLNRIRTVADLRSLDSSPACQTDLSRKAADKNRSLSSGRLSDMLLKAGAHLLEEEGDESLRCDRSMDITAPPAGCFRGFQLYDSPPPVVFTMGSPSGSPSYINSAWPLNSRRRNSETEAMDATPHSSPVFHPPELPEDTLMEVKTDTGDTGDAGDTGDTGDANPFRVSVVSAGLFPQQAHTDALTDLRFTLAFVHCVMEVASSKDPGLDAASGPDVSFLEQSLVTDQISLLSREWSYAEQLVLYMKAEEFLSSALHAAKEAIKQGRLLPSATAKQVIRKLNELYKSCVTNCRSLSRRLQTFLLDKQKLMDRFNGLTAEKLIYSHTVHMVQCAALDEMFHYGAASVQRYHKALLLMEGLCRIISEQKDIDSIDKCKQCIERRLSALQ